jgi:predicted DNA-binding protein (UPF0251 family)
MLVCHACDNPPCVNPDHLFLGTARDNCIDMMRKGRHYAGSRENMPRGSKHWNSKLSEYEVRKIRERVMAGEKQKDLASELGVSRATISEVVNRKLWRHA